MGGNFGQKKVPANLRLDRDNFGQNCPKGIRTRAYKKIATYNVHPEGVHIWVPFRAPIIMHTRRVCIWAPNGCPLEPGTSRRRVDERPKEKEIATYNGHPKGVPIWAGCPTQPINAPPSGVHMGTGAQRASLSPLSGHRRWPSKKKK